jgi:hypothetical protein
MPDVVRGWGTEEDAEVSDARSHRGFGFGMRDTLGGVRKQIPIPERRPSRKNDYRVAAWRVISNVMHWRKDDN